MTTILVIRPGAIGDTLLTFPILGMLRASYANPRIIFAGNAAVVPLALAWGLVDEASDYQSPRWSELFSTAGIQSNELQAMLRATDLAICWLRDPEHIVEQNLRAAGVQRIITEPGRPPEGERVHIVEYLARTIGLDSAALPNTPNTCRGEGGGAAWGGPSWSPGGNLPAAPNAPIVIHPGSGGARKCWPIEKFAAVIERVWQRAWPVLVLGGPADLELVQYVQRYLAPPSPEMLTLLLNAPLSEIAQQVLRCRCYLGNDSGITHLAAMLDVPTLALFGPSDPSIWHPVGKRVRVLREPEIEKLSIDRVIAAIDELHPNYPSH